VVDNFDEDVKTIKDILDEYPTENVGILFEKIDSLKSYHKRLKDEYDISVYHSRLSEEEEKKIFKNYLHNYIMTTFKSAKGVEFDVVIIPQFQDFTYKKRKEYYVGVTRAKSSVHLISVGKNPDILNDFDEDSYVEVNYE
jgi:DNA helicase IV